MVLELILLQRKLTQYPPPKETDGADVIDPPPKETDVIDPPKETDVAKPPPRETDVADPPTKETDVADPLPPTKETDDAEPPPTPSKKLYDTRAKAKSAKTLIALKG
ncbi:hypothetical protein TNIN_494671 [Trichonephila inaurata madagascariensis]|uniref:Uncharacterized protein n=1 Tax=Trichonephila inaurata madagascariensis TaxID=2747483 RepID=A0A8X6XQM8_9ARAC|nr:hypothetical protein TNIN_494671 [Trichonephila inaurata madagascariensis]